MADIKPNYDLERERIVIGIAELQLSVQRCNFRVAQLADEAARLEVNAAETMLKIQELQSELDSWDKTVRGSE